MGIVSISLSQSNNMKFLLVLAVAAYARAEAEAKPGFAYTVGTPLVYNTLPYVHHAPLAYHAPWSTPPLLAARTMMVPLSPALTVSSPTALFLLSPPLLLLRRRLWSL